jgi:hypothetical protein
MRHHIPIRVGKDALPNEYFVMSKSASPFRHTYIDLARQRVYPMASGYEDCNDATHFQIDAALCLA